MINSEVVAGKAGKGAGARRGSLPARLFRERYGILMLLPALLCTLIFSYAPLSGWIMAFTEYQPGKSMWNAPWIGFREFKSFFVDSGDALNVIRNTVVMNVASLVVGLGTAFLFAILLKELQWLRFGKLVQSVSFFPYFMSWVVLYAVIYSLFSTGSGAINETLLQMGILKEPLNILGDEAYAWGLIIVVNCWNSLGYNSVIFIATIAGIPSEQYEAAEIDGAGRFGKMFYVTIPNLLPTLVVLLIMNSGWIFNSGLDQFFMFTNPTNLSTMEVFDYYIYRFGLKLFNYPYATAVGIIKTVVSMVLLVAVNRVSKQISGKAIF